MDAPSEVTSESDGFSRVPVSRPDGMSRRDWDALLYLRNWVSGLLSWPEDGIDPVDEFFGDAGRIITALAALERVLGIEQL